MPILFLLLQCALGWSSFHDAPASVRDLQNPQRGNTLAGRKVFARNCASCHGQDGRGMGNVPDLSQASVKNATDGELFWFIARGSPDNGMPAIALSEKERWQVVDYLRSLESEGGAKTGAAPSTKPKTRNIFPPPAAPFTDYRYEAPGKSHKILASDLPAPEPQNSASNGPEVVPRPAKAWPKVPRGFKVQLFANGLDNPRALGTAPNGDIFLTESSAGNIRVFRGLNAKGKPDISEVFARGLNRPYGMAFHPSGAWLYVGDVDAVMRIPYHSGDLQAHGAPEKVADLPHLPTGHWTRDLQFSADGKKLFVGVGSASNINDPETHPAEKNRAAILAMNAEGKDLTVYAWGIRNAGGGLAIQPQTGDLWCSVNERDALGDNLVPDYVTHVTPGGFYGWPWWYIGPHQDPRFAGSHSELREKVIAPDVLVQPHNASLQLAFYTGSLFPAEFRGDLFVAQHGSWNRSVRTGYELIRIPFHGNTRPTGEYEDFMTGFVVDGARVWGRPVGVTVAPDGSLLVSDDGSNSIWRISYKGR